jgi:hypothetical protein
MYEYGVLTQVMGQMKDRQGLGGEGILALDQAGQPSGSRAGASSAPRGAAIRPSPPSPRIQAPERSRLFEYSYKIMYKYNIQT